MKMRQLIECVPNISEGRDMSIINEIAHTAETVEGVKLLDIDPGRATNRTVKTFVGEPDAVIEAAYRLIKKASELIDMRKHKGEHPRMGATDVCPLVPIANISMEETAGYAQKLGERVGKELNIPVYLYENAAKIAERKNLAYCRSGEYEGLSKISEAKWKPDFGPDKFNASVQKTGVTAVGARDFLIAYNVNLNTTSSRRANSIAFDLREAGRVKREGNPLTGKIITDKNGEPVREPGKLKSVKGIGWYIEEYGIAQLSLNLTNISITPMHIAFDEACKSALERGIRVTGSEIVGLVPLQAMLDAADYFLIKQERSLGISEKEKIKIAVKSLGLDDLGPFNPEEKIIEYMLDKGDQNPLVNMKLTDFAVETSAESPAPGGGSVAAYVGALGISLGTMVANLSAHKRGWDDRWEEFSSWAVKGMELQKKLLAKVDQDTEAFNQIMEAFGLPKSSEEEIKQRKAAIEEATKHAINVPYEVMTLALDSLIIIEKMTEIGNPNSVTDAAVGGLCARTAVMGAFLNVKINAAGLEDKAFAKKIVSQGEKVLARAQKIEENILKITESKI
ncbi:MAG TPA: glutamate formimidoyltransferase [Flavobacteriales bacterium]|nr:glutamate formimidoyltransferase [Flavobacteriales bacterium]